LHKNGDSLQDDTVATDETQLVMQREAAKHKRLDKRTRVLWLALMGHEDSLFRKITVNQYCNKNVRLSTFSLSLKMLACRMFGLMKNINNIKSRILLVLSYIIFYIIINFIILIR
jgi:hypothetical protein